MAVELSVRGVGQKQSQSLVVETGISLTRASDVAFPGGGSEVVGHEKFGRDLAVRLSDGQTLKIGDFFVIDPQGDFSRLLDDRGEPMVTGLTAPEPSLEDIGPGFDSQISPDMAAPGGAVTRAAAFAESDGSDGGMFGDGATGGGEGGLFGGGSTMLTAGAGLAAGFGAMSLLSEDQDDDDDDDGGSVDADQALSPDSGTAVADGEALQQYIDELLGGPEGGDDVSRALDDAFSTALQDATAPDGDPADGDTLDPPQASDPTAPVFGEVTDFSSVMAEAPDLLLPLTAEGET